MKHFFIDFHCDTLMVLFGADPENANLYDSKYTCVDFSRMKKGGGMAQFFAMFLLPSDAWNNWMPRDPVSDEEYVQTLIGYYNKNLQEHSDIIGPALNASDIKNNWAAGKMSALLSVEDGRAINSDLKNIERYYQMGIRALTLTWNYANCFGSPNSAVPDIMNLGLTPFGKEAVVYMQELGMIVDVSHLSDGGFWDVSEICKKPFVATHSNCRALAPHLRNLTDEMLKKLGECGGVAGLNFGPQFLNVDPTVKTSKAAVIAKHARHMANVGGLEVVALGTDFDGIGGDLEIKDCSMMPILADELLKQDFTEREIDYIYHKNVLRVLEDTL